MVESKRDKGISVVALTRLSKEELETLFNGLLSSLEGRPGRPPDDLRRLSEVILQTYDGVTPRKLIIDRYQSDNFVQPRKRASNSIRRLKKRLKEVNVDIVVLDAIIIARRTPK